jgi:hypothetical protein
MQAEHRSVPAGKAYIVAVAHVSSPRSLPSQSSPLSTMPLPQTARCGSHMQACQTPPTQRRVPVCEDAQVHDSVAPSSQSPGSLPTGPSVLASPPIAEAFSPFTSPPQLPAASPAPTKTKEIESDPGKRRIKPTRLSSFARSSHAVNRRAHFKGWIGQ